MLTEFRKHGSSYLVALGATAAAVLLHVSLGGVLGNFAPIAGLVIGIVAAAWYGGLRAGLLATVLSTLAGIYFFVDLSRAIASPSSVVAIVTFTFIGVMVSFLSESLHASLRRNEAQRSDVRRREERYALALKHSKTGVWDYELTSGSAVWSEALYEIAGLPPGAPLTFETIIGLIHPDDRELVIAAARPMVLAAEEITMEFRIHSPRHNERWIFVAGKGTTSDDGQVVRLAGIARDITDSKRAEEALHESEQRFARFMQHLPGLAWIKDSAGRYVYANAAAANIFRVPLQELHGKTDDELFPPEAAAAFKAHDRQALESGAGVQVLEDLRHADGIDHTSIVNKFPIPGPAGSAVLIGGMAIDITDRKQAEEALRQSEARKAAVLNMSLDAIITIDHAGRVVEFNPAAQRMFGYDREQAVGQVMADLIIPPALRERHRTGITHYLATGEGPVLNRRLELAAMRSSGEQFPVEVAITRLDQPGPPLFTGYIRELTEQKRAEEDLRVAQEQLQLVADTMDAPVTRCSRDYKYLWANKPYADWIGRPAAEIVGRPIVEILGQEAFDRLKPHFDRVLSGHRVRYEDVANFQAQGRRWINATYSPTFDRAGAPDGWVAVVIDIHERKQLEEALREADRRKDAFLATLAHELRNPLAPIRSSLGILKSKSPPDAELAWSRDVIDRQVQQMVRLLDDLLDVSRISRNKLELRKEQIEVAAVVESAIETSRPLIEAAGHKLTVVVPDEPVYLDADPVRLAQVLANLLNNAAKYTQPGGVIHLHAQRQGSDVVVTVADNGMGIAAEMFPHLFEMFSQAAPALERSQGGLGIGLSLVKGLVDMHGGSIEARSPGPGQGSQFAIRLPIVVQPAARPSHPGKNGDLFPESKCRILVVDDNRDGAESLSRMLRILGHDVRLGYDGQQAVEAAEAFLPELVFLDIGMPKLNGYEAARQIRRQPWGQSMVLIALTGWGREEDRRATEEAGFDFHLVKPGDVAAISKLIAGIQTGIQKSAISGPAIS